MQNTEQKNTTSNQGETVKTRRHEASDEQIKNYLEMRSYRISHSKRKRKTIGEKTNSTNKKAKPKTLASASLRKAKRDIQVPLLPSVSAPVCSPLADGFCRPASTASNDAAFTMARWQEGLAASPTPQPRPSESSSPSVASSSDAKFFSQKQKNDSNTKSIDSSSAEKLKINFLIT